MTIKDIGNPQAYTSGFAAGNSSTVLQKKPSICILTLHEKFGVSSQEARTVSQVQVSFLYLIQQQKCSIFITAAYLMLKGCPQFTSLDEAAV